MRFVVNDQIYYAIGYKDVDWWFSPRDYCLYSREELREKYRYTSDEAIQESGQFIPFVRENEADLERGYIEKYYPRFAKEIRQDDDGLSFRIFIERHDHTGHWHTYQRQKLQEAVIRWCKENHIPYE